MKKINKAGYLAITVVGIMVLAGAILGGRAIWVRIRGLDGLRPVSPVSTQTPERVGEAEPENTVEAESSMPTEPLPEGWSVERDPFTGDNYLAPSFEVETAVREAFDAVLSLEVISDRSNEDALAFDNKAALARAEALATGEVMERYAHPGFVDLGTMGPRNPVQCQDYDTCRIVQAKLGVVAFVLYDPETCVTLDTGILAEYKGTNGSFLLAGDGSRCVTRFVEHDNPYASYLATVELDGDKWIVTDMMREAIPEPSGN